MSDQPQDAALLPLWREAVKNFLLLKLEPGSVIKKPWLIEQFGLRTPETAQEQIDFGFEFLRQFTEFRDELLEVHFIELRAVSGVGYEIVHPRDQTKLALVTRTRNISSEFKKMARSISCVNLTSLTDSERRDHSDGLAKAATMRSMFSRRKLLGRVE